MKKSEFSGGTGDSKSSWCCGARPAPPLILRFQCKFVSVHVTDKSVVCPAPANTSVLDTATECYCVLESVYPLTARLVTPSRLLVRVLVVVCRLSRTVVTFCSAALRPMLALRQNILAGVA